MPESGKREEKYGVLSFREEVSEQIKGFSRKQCVYFAWLCAVRSLPLLCRARDFACWVKSDRQKHLAAIFRALDVAAAANAAAANAAYAAAAVAAAVNAANAYAASYAAANANANAANTVAANAANAAAAYATNASYAAAAYAVSAAATYAAANAKMIEAFRDTLRDDIKAIRTAENKAFHSDVGIYGDIWDNFQTDLIAAGCGYWAKLYKNIFENGFTLDDAFKKELQRRLNVPDEIQEQGAAAIGRYLEQLGDDIEKINEARIIILGEKGAGKTSLARRLINIDAEMPQDYESTEGVETRMWKFPDKDETKDMIAHIWDFAGHSITHSAHRCFMSARCLYIYVYNGREERDNDPAYWLEQIRIHGGDSPVLFLINERDDHKTDIAEKTLKKNYPSIIEYYRVDIGSDDKAKLRDFRQIVMDTVRNNPSWNSQIVSARAYRIKNELRERFIKTNAPHITKEEFAEIAGEDHEKRTNTEDILNNLHTLGICFWYDKDDMKEFNTLVLNPDWITNGIYRIFNKGFNDSRYSLTTNDGVEMLKDEKRYNYPFEMVKYLFRLMRVYELAFFKDDGRVFIPGILPVDEPDDIPGFKANNDCLEMSFNVKKALPPNIVSRIIVQRGEHNEIYNEHMLWRKGAVLKASSSDATALIVESGTSITVQVEGADKTAYISSLRDTIKGIFDSYKVINPVLMYKVLIPEETEKDERYRLRSDSETTLILPENLTINYVEASHSYFHELRDIYLDETAKKYNIACCVL